MNDVACIGAAGLGFRCIDHSQDLHENETEVLVRHCCPGSANLDYKLCNVGNENVTTEIDGSPALKFMDLSWLWHAIVGFLACLTVFGVAGVILIAWKRRTHYRMYSKVTGRKGNLSALQETTANDDGGRHRGFSMHTLHDEVQFEEGRVTTCQSQRPKGSSINDIIKKCRFL